MKRLTYLFAILLISSVVAWADETITVTATNSDISANLDLKVVAKLFGEAKDLEDFEKKLNDPQAALVNLDLNGDGDVDYIRVIETTSGNKHLIVLQAVLAKDIYQDVASIYVEKDEDNNVSVQVIGDEYIYGTNYVIEPVYIYRPVIYDWFWGPTWTCWYSPWYWGYWPVWWTSYACVNYAVYRCHCYDYHHHHHCCSFHYVQEARPASHRMAEGVSHREHAAAHPEGSFAQRNEGITNARQFEAVRQPTSRTPSSAQNTYSAAGAGVSNHSMGGTSNRGGSTSASSTRTPSSGSTRSYTSTHSINNNAATRNNSSVVNTQRGGRTYSTSSSTNRTYSTGNSTYSNGNTYSGSSSRSGYTGSSNSSRSTYTGGSHSSGSSRSFTGGGGHSAAPASRPAGGGSTRR